MRIRRGPLPTDNFTMVENAIVERVELSWAAKGIYVYLLSRPPGWETSAKRIAESYEGGDHLVRGALQQLEDAGLLVRSRYRDDRGQWQGEMVLTGSPGAIIAPGLTSHDAVFAAGKTASPSNTEEQEENSVLSPNTNEEQPRGSDPFDAFYGLYPRKVGKPVAARAYRAALKRKADPVVVLAGLEQWLRYWRAESTRTEFIPHPSTWLNQERWNDDPWAANGLANPTPPVPKLDPSWSIDVKPPDSDLAACAWWDEQFALRWEDEA